LTRKLRELRAEGLELVEGQENAFAAIGPVPGVKKVIRMHGGHHFFAVTLGKKPRAWRAWQERRSFEQADAICAVSRFVAETTRELLGLGRREIAILPNFVDTGRFFPRGADAEEGGLIVFAGTLCEKKGIRQLILAMPAILAGAPRARLVVAGRDQADASVGGSFLAYLRSLMTNEVAAHVEFLGAVAPDQMPGLLARASVCVYPSHMEAMPMAWLEAMAMGKAVVGSVTGPGPEVIRDGEDGLLCNPHEPEDIAHAVLRCLKDLDLRRRLGEGARRRVEAEFTPEAMLSKNVAFYERVLRG